ncbi:MAG: SirB2 family protein [Thiotrichales bacterium]
MYPILLKVHLIAVVLSLLGFLVRGAWMFTDSRLLKSKLTRILPHIVDTMLLVAGVALAVMASLNPLDQPWLAAKILALLVYIVLGTIAIKRGRTKTIRGIAWVLALLVFAYMMWVGHSKQLFF